MKTKILCLSLFSLLSAALFTSCNDDDGYSLDEFYLSYGTISGSGLDFDIIRDDGAVLYIVASEITIDPREIVDGERVYVNYTILDDEMDGEQLNYQVRLNDLTHIRLKDPVVTEQPDTLGIDPIDVSDMWFGSKYLNVNFNIYFQSGFHTINLAVDQSNPRADQNNVYLQLRHDAHGDPATYYGFGRISFDLSSLLPAGQPSINIHLTYTDYDGETITDTGLFTGLYTMEAPPRSAPFPDSKMQLN